MKRKALIVVIKKIGLAALLGLPFFLMFLPSDYFDDGESICPSKVLLDFECLGCGLTRATMHLLHFEFLIAWEYNKLVFPLFILGFLFWLHLFGKLINVSILPFMNKLY